MNNSTIVPDGPIVSSAQTGIVTVRLNVPIPVVPDARDLRLCEIVLDSKRLALRLCTGAPEHNGVLDFELCADERGPGALTVATLRTALVFFDRYPWTAYTPTDNVQAFPTIAVGAFDGHTLHDGELYLDPSASRLYVGLSDTNFMVPIR